jgi:hypothetical protein
MRDRDDAVDDDLVRRVADSLGIQTSEAARVIGEVIAYYHEPLESVIRRRHAACKLRGMTNDQIYPLLVTELADRVVAAPELSERQIRRIIYG